MTHTIVRLAAATAFGLLVALPAQAQSAAPAAPAPSRASPAKPKKEPSAGQLAARARQKTCSAEWKAAKGGGKLNTGMTWPQFWSACNKRLKSTNV